MLEKLIPKNQKIKIMRTTKAQLESQVEQINMLTNSPMYAYQTITDKTGMQGKKMFND